MGGVVRLKKKYSLVDCGDMAMYFQSMVRGKNPISFKWDLSASGELGWLLVKAKIEGFFASRVDLARGVGELGWLKRR